MLMQLYPKNQKSLECQFFIKLGKTHLGPILTPFGRKNLKQDFSTKIYLKLTLRFYVAVASCKK